MNLDKKPPRILDDMKINVKIKISALWISLMFLYLYNDVFTFYRKDTIDEVLSGEVAGIQITPVFLLGAAVLLAIPIFMIILSLALPAKVNRWTNIVVGVFHAALLIVTVLVPGDIWVNYILYMLLEAVFIALIVWHAWKWPKRLNSIPQE